MKTKRTVNAPKYQLGSLRPGHHKNVELIAFGNGRWNNMVAQYALIRADDKIVLARLDHIWSSVVDHHRGNREMRSAYAKLAGIKVKEIEEYREAKKKEDEARENSRSVERLKREAERLGYRVERAR